VKDYGVVTDFQLEFRDGVFNLSGIPHQGNLCVQVLSRRAAHLLWYALTQHLFPSDAPPITSIAGTAPLSLTDHPDLTSHVDVRPGRDELYEVRGVTRTGGWRMLVSSADVQWLWATLDVTLYPVGWEGRESRSGAAYA